MDKIYRFLMDDANVRGEYVQLESAWQELTACTTYPAPVKKILGEALVAVSLMSATIKFTGSLSIQLNNGSPVNLLVVQATSDGGLRGMARWGGDLDVEPTVPNLFGDQATLVITVEPEPGQGERYQSIVNLGGETLAECLTAYFEQSEQLKTRLELAVSDTSAAGLLVQRLPGEAEDDDGWNRASMLAETVKSEELLMLDVETLLHRLFHEENVRLFDGEPLRFACSCSQEKVDNMLASMGEDEANKMLKEKGSIEVDCDFCNTHYSVDEIDLARIFSDGLISGNDSVH
ncbi:Hsp33 family molecular chaperone HslO [Leucothrix sargassi]|nr:Hsp33 family molecular chaperone HslO [Leucothrix sargassi]